MLFGVRSCQLRYCICWPFEAQVDKMYLKGGTHDLFIQSSNDGSWHQLPSPQKKLSHIIGQLETYFSSKDHGKNSHVCLLIFVSTTPLGQGFSDQPKESPSIDASGRDQSLPSIVVAHLLPFVADLIEGVVFCRGLNTMKQTDWKSSDYISTTVYTTFHEMCKKTGWFLVARNGSNFTEGFLDTPSSLVPFAFH